ncbi:MAG: hypothetical protein ABI867_18455 [Kofleriaceae bacterium]
MLRLVILASFLGSSACGGGGGGDDDMIDAPPSAACLEATTYQNLNNIEEKIFKGSCIFSGCHNGGATDAGRLNLKTGMAHAAIVGVASDVDTGFQIVVPGSPEKSYLMVMLGEIAPGDADPATVAPPAAIGLMPQGTGGALLCPEKRAAVKRWIVAGAPND